MCRSAAPRNWSTTRLAVLIAVLLGASACGGDPNELRDDPAPSVLVNPSPSASKEAHAALVARGDPAPVDGRPGLVSSFRLTSSGEIVTTGRDGLAAVRDRDGEPRRLLRGHRARVLAAAMLPDKRIVTGGADGRVLVHGPAGSAPVTLRAAGAPVVELAASADVVAAVDLSGVATWWDTAGARLGTHGGAAFAVTRARVLADGSALALASREEGALVIVARDGNVRNRLDGLGEVAERFVLTGGRDRVLVPSVAGELVRVGSDGSTETLWRHGATVLDVHVGPGGEVASASLDGTVRVIAAEARIEVQHGAPVHVVRVAQGAARVVTVGADRSLRTWDASGGEIARVGDRSREVTGAAVSPDGGTVACWSGTGSLELRSVTGDLLVTVPGTDSGVLDARFSADGTTLVILGADRTIRTWPLLTEGLTRRAAAPRVAHAIAPADVAGHAGPEWCARCHRPEYERWLESSHAWTSTLASEDTLPPEVVRGGLVHHDPGATRFGRDDDGWWAETAGHEGDVERFRLTHVAGHLRMRMLLTTLDDGRMQVLPGMVEWPGGPWFDYTHLLYGDGADPESPPTVRPGESGFWTGAVRSWDQRCAVCHTSGRVAREPGPDGKGPRSVWRSLGVDCETCHGPGRAHAEAWERGETGTPMQGLQELPRETAVAVCTQCHMEGDRVTPTYVIGEPLYEHLDPTVAIDPLRADPYGRALELIYDGLPFGTSRCAEEGGLTCSRCHEPHGGPVRSQLRVDPGSGELCAGCHEDIAREGRAHTGHDPRGSGGACVSCHMPFLTIERGHGAVADHTIGVPILDLPGDRVATDPCTWCHQEGRKAPSDAPRIGAEALRDAYARWWPDARGALPWMEAVAAARLDEPGAASRLVSVARDASAPRLVRASATRLLERYPGTEIDALLELSRDPDSLVRRHALQALAASEGALVDERLATALADPSRIVRVNAARAALRGWKRVRENRKLLLAAIPVLEEDVAQITDDAYRWFLLGAARGLAGDDAGALAAYERVLALDPTANAVRTHVERLRSRLGGR